MGRVSSRAKKNRNRNNNDKKEWSSCPVVNNWLQIGAQGWIIYHSNGFSGNLLKKRRRSPATPVITVFNCWRDLSFLPEEIVDFFNEASCAEQKTNFPWKPRSKCWHIGADKNNLWASPVVRMAQWKEEQSNQTSTENKREAWVKQKGDMVGSTPRREPGCDRCW